MNPIYVKHYSESVSFAKALGLAYDALVHGPSAFDAMAVWKALSERIAQGIYMGEGLLLPHTRVPGLSEPLLAFVVCPPGFTDIQVKAGQVPQFMCLLLSPAESATCHTQVIAKIARKLLNPQWRAKALAATTPEELTTLFEE
ncbi:PTS sugar transporter subunit IIA [uncultured Fibrobacter sp.]|uniref:PTS sugar transporter subunit IIA n=1 Tax=uncultured Fibrobacter sp. TaxID=261512 RepID=UPI002607B8ED|nr:PTS sugar transporter subunit IIA [uncultured Fibrobacter sp.]